jgi:hypothetical protein
MKVKTLWNKKREKPSIFLSGIPGFPELGGRIYKPLTDNGFELDINFSEVEITRLQNISEIKLDLLEIPIKQLAHDHTLIPSGLNPESTSMLMIIEVTDTEDRILTCIIENDNTQNLLTAGQFVARTLPDKQVLPENQSLTIDISRVIARVQEDNDLRDLALHLWTIHTKEKFTEYNQVLKKYLQERNK